MDAQQLLSLILENSAATATARLADSQAEETCKLARATAREARKKQNEIDERLQEALRGFGLAGFHVRTARESAEQKAAVEEFEAKVRAAALQSIDLKAIVRDGFGAEHVQQAKAE